MMIYRFLSFFSDRNDQYRLQRLILMKFKLSIHKAEQKQRFFEGNITKRGHSIIFSRESKPIHETDFFFIYNVFVALFVSHRVLLLFFTIMFSASNIIRGARSRFESIKRKCS